MHLPRSLPQLQTLGNGEPNFVNPYLSGNSELYGQNRLLQQLPSRLDNRNTIMDPSLFGRAKPKCNKRIRIANGVSRFRDKGSLVRLLGTTIAVCLRDQWSEPPPICVRPGCRRVLAPQNGVTRLSFSGAVADFLCKDGHVLEGSPVVYCDGQRWNDTEPICAPIHPLTTTTAAYWEWPQPKPLNDSEIQLSSDEQLESWDYNNPSTTIGWSTSKTTENPDLGKEISDTSLPISHQPTTTFPDFLPVRITETTATPSSVSNSTVSQSILPSYGAVSNANLTTTKLISDSTTVASLPNTEPATLPTTTLSDSTTETALISDAIIITTTEIVKTSSSTESNLPSVEVTVTEENWEPFPDNTFDKFDKELGVGSYETRDQIPEFIQPISPHKLDDDHDDHYTKLATISVVGGIVLGALGTLLLVGGVATYCWRKNIGIARPHAGDIDGRTLSGSDANDDFMWVDSNSRGHRMSRL
ncbi:Sushi, von Willebrand factor type A, EGF and pentraxin domain-containing protein 1 [Folsomia candida]|uniref:Sushi, von Willebrand factor type A, EGF and pentraxin domain-containing protein 1 n=1 Tax=Folsomia candida TaxID=158441 RepID=A0A226EIF3_FOLCA|nr:Sushi, von Willebrand factor type A, EGF and pentraxin domain-containing protein 1 [Folsomia candida]